MAIVNWVGRTNKHSGVSGIPTQLLVLHSAESPLRAGYARSLSQWCIDNPGIQSSWHRFVDPVDRVRLVDDNHAAWHASEANPMSIGWEQAGYARFSRDEWLTPEGKAQLELLAQDMAEVAVRDGIPAVWLTTEQVTAVTTHGNRQIKGFCIHAQIDPENRYDPGSGYPYDLLMSRIKAYMGGDNTLAEQKEEEEMALPAAQYWNDLITAVDKINKRTQEMHDRIFSRDQQRWFNPKTMEVQNKPFAGGIAARSTDIHDVMATNKLIQDGFNTVLKGLGEQPGIDAGAMKALEDKLVTVFDAATKNMEITFKTEPVKEITPNK